MPHGEINQELISEVADGDKLLTTREAARILGLHPESLKRRKDIPRIRVGQLRWRSSVIYAARDAATRAKNTRR
jgi:hypothetical protein